MRTTFPPKSFSSALSLLIAILATIFLFAALAEFQPAAAQTPTPGTEQPDDDISKPESDEGDLEGKLPVESVIDEPRLDSALQPTDSQSTATPANFIVIDYDTDDDGLIEISYLEQLNAIRWDLNGSGVSDSSNDDSNYREAFYGADLDMGCPSSGCRGYELTRSLDFDDPSSYASGSINTAWTQGEGWLQIGYTDPIGSTRAAFDAIFDGNNHTISNLYSSNGLDDQGLFLATSYTARIVRVGLINIDLTLNYDYQPWGGGLVSINNGLVAHSYATGSVTTEESGHNVGGLVGINWGVIAYSYADVDVTDIGGYETGGLVGDNHTIVVSSYAMGSVSGSEEVGGLVGDNEGGGIIYSYAIGGVTGNSLIGGLTGDNRESLIRSSYWNTQTSGQSVGVGTGPSDGIEGKTTTDLQSPTWYHGIYSDWHHAGDTWDFGTSTQYPTIKSGLDLGLDTCEQSISAIGRVGIIGEWADDCPSENDPGSYARFYTFTLDTASEITINLMGDLDTYLYLLEGAGRHGRIIEQDDDSGYGTDSRMKPSLQPGTYTIEATTYSSGAAGYFGLIIDGVPLATPPPPFSLYHGASQANASITSVKAGQSLDLTVRMHNVRGTGEHGGISVSFPDLNTDTNDSVEGNLYSATVADVERVSYTSGLSRVAFHKPGEDVIYHSNNNRQFTARDLLVESDDPSWSQGDDRTLTLRITPKQEGEFRMLIRGWICADTTDEGEYTNCSRRPSSSDTPDTDQQGYPAHELVINVTARVTPPITGTPELKAVLETCGIGERDPHKGYYRPGDWVRLSARVHNESYFAGFLTELGGLTGGKLFVTFEFLRSDGSLIGSVSSGSEHVFAESGKPRKKEFTVRVPADTSYEGTKLLPEGTTNIACKVFTEKDSKFQDYSGRADGISSGIVSVSDTLVHARRLVNYETVSSWDGTEHWSVEASVSPPEFNPTGMQTLTVTVEHLNDRFSLDHNLMKVILPEEGTWVDYDAIKKWVLADDGRYEEYGAEREAGQYDAVAFWTGINPFTSLPGAGTFIGLYELLVGDFLFEDLVKDTYVGVEGHNCVDEVRVFTLLPLNVNPTNELLSSYDTKGIQVEIPVQSELISLSVHPDIKRGGAYTAPDLLGSGNFFPPCEPPSSTSP